MNSQIALKQLKALNKFGSPMRLAAQGWKYPWQTLISIILSARTRDETTILVARNLFKKFPTLKKLSNAKISEIEKIIFKINFYKNKSKNVLNCAKSLVKNFNGKVPQEIEELIMLPGVGRKTANVFISEYGKDGIGVDTHVDYISRFLNWTQQKTADKIEKDLKKLFPKKYWSRVNPTLVRFGKTHKSKIKKDKLLGEIKRLK